MLDILARLCEGSGAKDDLDRLHQLANAVKQQSLCGLGRTAPNPVLTGLRYFREEFLEHIENIHSFYGTLIGRARGEGYYMRGVPEVADLIAFTRAQSDNRFR